jgi:multidrug efflux pump subunit AcrA (membrane-fusion protein)
VTVAQGQNGRNGFDPGTREILRELRDLRVEMRADRRQAAQEAADDRRQAAEDRRQAAEAQRQSAEAQRQYAEERRRSDQRFERLLREFREDSARREGTTQKMFKDIHTVGLAIVKTLNRHTRLLERHGHLLDRIDRKLGARDNGRPGPGNGPRAAGA